MADQLLTGTTLVESTSRSDGDSPVGSIVAWAKSFTGVPNLPVGWLECDGSVISDALSSMNGETLPDLNGDNRFLRGNSTSGDTGGSETHNHTIPGLGYEDYLQVDYSEIITTGSGDDADVQLDATASGVGTNISRITTSTTSTLPTYYEIVWIMRIR